MNSIHPLPEEPRTVVISRLETQQCTATIHFLESSEQALSAGLKHNEAYWLLTGWRVEDRYISRQKASKHSIAQQLLTF